MLGDGAINGLDNLLRRHSEFKGHNEPMMIANFIMLILGGHVLFPVMLICILVLQNVHSRNTVFLNFCGGWVIHSISFSLLLYIGKAVGDQPDFGLCLFQSILVYMVPVLTSASFLSLVINLWSNINPSMAQHARHGGPLHFVLILGPYLLSLIPAFMAAISSMYHPELVRRDPEDFYCSVDYALVRITVCALSALFLLISLVIQAMTARTLYMNRLAFKQVRVQGWGLFHLFGRMSLFMIVSLTGAIMALIATIDPTNHSRTIYQSALPLVTFLLFGTRPDFYRKTPPAKVTSDASKEDTESTRRFIA